jgi:hypothetical protein
MSEQQPDPAAGVRRLFRAFVLINAALLAILAALFLRASG